MPKKKKDGSDRKDYDNSKRRSCFFSAHKEEAEKAGFAFGEHLKAARKNNEYNSGERFSQEIGMSYNTYKAYEAGTYNKNDVFFIKFLSEKLNVSADYLIGLSDNMHPDYDEVIQKTGLSSDSIAMLCHLNNIDDENVDDNTVKYNGYMDFINCFLGNKTSTELFFQAFLPLIHDLSNACEGEEISTRMQHTMAAQITDLIYEYIYKVVIPSFYEQYNTGTFNPVDPKLYLTDKEAVKASTKKRKKREG